MVGVVGVVRVVGVGGISNGGIILYEYYMNII